MSYVINGDKRSIMDPNTLCFLEGDVLIFQGRIDEDIPAFEHRTLPLGGERLWMTPEKFADMKAEARLAWSQIVSDFWTCTDRVQRVLPVIVGDQDYARGTCVLRPHRTVRDHNLVWTFLINQPGTTPAQWLAFMLILAYFEHLKKTDRCQISRLVWMIKKEGVDARTAEDMIQYRPENFFSCTSGEAAAVYLRERGDKAIALEDVEQLRTMMHQAISREDHQIALKDVLEDDPDGSKGEPHLRGLEVATLDQALARVCNRLDRRLFRQVLKEGVPKPEKAEKCVLDVLISSLFLDLVAADIVLAGVYG